MRKAPLTVLAGLVVLATLPAVAQTNPYQRRAPLPRESFGSYRAEPTYSARALAPSATAPGYGGAIRWNTPNANGNLGGPSVGGGPNGG